MSSRGLLQADDIDDNSSKILATQVLIDQYEQGKVEVTCGCAENISLYKKQVYVLFVLVYT